MPTRWWVLGPDNKPYGPYDAGHIAQYAREGRVTSATMLCADGTEQWIPASQVPEVADSVPPGLPHPQPMASAMAGGWRPIGLVGPILVTIFCCLVGGIISIVYAAQAGSKFAAGDVEGARVSSKNATVWMWIGFGVGLVVSLSWTLFMVVGMVAASATGGLP